MRLKSAEIGLLLMAYWRQTDMTRVARADESRQPIMVHAAGGCGTASVSLWCRVALPRVAW